MNNKLGLLIALLIAALASFFVFGYVVLSKIENTSEDTADHSYGVVMEITDDKVWLMDMNSNEFISINNNWAKYSSITEENRLKFLQEGDFVDINNSVIIAKSDMIQINGVAYDMYDEFKNSTD